MQNDTTHDPERLLSAKEIAAYLGVTTRTVFRWRRDGKLAAPIAVAGSKRIKRWPASVLTTLLSA